LVGVPPPPRGGILGVKYLNSTVCRRLVFAKYSLQKGCTQNPHYKEVSPGEYPGLAFF
jgi:hypothetical protein